MLPVFDAVLADIGDQQSIQMSLSTFSGHMGNIVAILDAATGRSLVLLDELAAGTDPSEGSALAQALLERLSGQARLTVVTTHYAELKEWASSSDGAANAATAYDVETDTPLYRVVLGRAGTSHALQVAERLGLDPAVVATRGSASCRRCSAPRSCWPRQRTPSGGRGTSVPPRPRSVTRPGGSPSRGAGSWPSATPRSTASAPRRRRSAPRPASGPSWSSRRRVQS